MTFPELDSTFTRILSMLLTGAIVVSPFALAYVLWTYFHSDKPRPMLYTALVVALFIITVAGIYLGTIGYLRMTEREVPEWALPEFSAIAGLALLVPVIVMAVLFRRLRRSGS
jgi:predicted benzoate:H+ symporter BenE